MLLGLALVTALAMGCGGAAESAAEVRDFWKDQTPPAGSALPAARGGLAVGRLRLSSPPSTM